MNGKSYRLIQSRRQRTAKETG